MISIVRRLNEEFSITVIMSEHKADSVFPFIDKAVFLKDGRIEFVDNAHNICSEVIDDEIFEKIKQAGVAYYKFYAILEGEEQKAYVSDFSKAEEIVAQLKKKDSSNIELETAKSHINTPNSILIISASRDYGLDDLIFGPKERKILKTTNIPTMLINPRGDLYALCD